MDHGSGQVSQEITLSSLLVAVATTHETMQSSCTDVTSLLSQPALVAGPELVARKGLTTPASRTYERPESGIPTPVSLHAQVKGQCCACCGRNRCDRPKPYSTARKVGSMEWHLWQFKEAA